MKEVERLKFKLKKGKGAVNRFVDAAGVTHYPGDIVDLPESYKGVKWLEPVEKKTKIAPPPAKPEPAPTLEPTVPLEASAKKPRKK